MLIIPSIIKITVFFFKFTWHLPVCPADQHLPRVKGNLLPGRDPQSIWLRYCGPILCTPEKLDIREYASGSLRKNSSLGNCVWTALVPAFFFSRSWQFGNSAGNLAYILYNHKFFDEQTYRRERCLDPEKLSSSEDAN